MIESKSMRILAAVCLLSLVVFLGSEFDKMQNHKRIEIYNDEQTADKVSVKIDGEVAKPGTYLVPADFRVCDVIYKAGGVTSDAVLDNVNLTSVVTDSLSVHIPSDGEQTNTSFCVININSASKEDLMLIPGVGETTAERIIAYRKSNGAFKKPKDIINVEGIGKKTLANMIDYIKTED